MNAPKFSNFQQVKFKKEEDDQGTTGKFGKEEDDLGTFNRHYIPGAWNHNVYVFGAYQYNDTHVVGFFP